MLTRRGFLATAVIGLAAAALWQAGVGDAAEGALGVTAAGADAYTPVIVRVLGPPTFPFLGSDNKYHVAYDLELQNASPLEVTLEKLDVVNAADPSRVIVSYSGPALVDPGCPFGNCNRLRALARVKPVANTAIASEQGRIVFVDFAFDSLDAAPKSVLHHFYGRGAASPAAKAPTPIDYLVAPYDISAGRPIVIGPPVTGKGWVALNGCCAPGFPHRSSPSVINGRMINAQRFAIDWKRMNDQGAFYVGDKTKNESYVDYGSAILAVADGSVVDVADDLEANPPGILPANDPVLGPKLTVQTVEGNHIVLDLGHGVFAFYAHLLKGSVRVKVGERVTKGEVMAKLGNTGNSNASHLHFHLMDGPSALGSNGLPYVIDRFDYDGQMPIQTLLDADDYLSGHNFGEQRLAIPEPRTNQLPLAWAIVNFPG
jgi:hypothetical protein